jgi:hypothetical protein
METTIYTNENIVIIEEAEEKETLSLSDFCEITKKQKKEYENERKKLIKDFMFQFFRFTREERIMILQKLNRDRIEDIEDFDIYDYPLTPII